jgi:hypothetical protein
LVLLDRDDTLIDAHFLLEGEHIDTVISFEMPVHKVTVGKRIEDFASTIQDKQA